MTHIRRKVEGDSVYLYSVRSYRDPETKMVREESRYLGREIVETSERMLLAPLDRKSVKRVLDLGSYILYRVTEDHGFIRQYDGTLYGPTEIKQAARKIFILAAESMLGPGHSAYVHIGLHELSNNGIRDIVDLVGRKDTDTIGDVLPLLSGQL